MGPRRRKALHDGSQGLREVDDGVRSRTFAEELPDDGRPFYPRVDWLIRFIARQAARGHTNLHRNGCGCSATRIKGTCDNHLKIDREYREEIAPDGLRTHLMRRESLYQGSLIRTLGISGVLRGIHARTEPPTHSCVCTT